MISVYKTPHIPVVSIRSLTPRHAGIPGLGATSGQVLRVMDSLPQVVVGGIHLCFIERGGLKGSERATAAAPWLMWTSGQRATTAKCQESWISGGFFSFFLLMHFALLFVSKGVFCVSGHGGTAARQTSPV